MKQRSVWVVECRFSGKLWKPYDAYFTKREALHKAKVESGVGEWRVVRYQSKSGAGK